MVLAITHPKSDHAYEKMWADSVADLATEHGVPVHIANKPDEDFKAALKAARPDIIVANNWRTWLPRDVFDAPRYGTLNIHDSLLPKYTGFSPLIWALINGEQEVGLTAHLMDEELDAGDIVLQRSTPVGPKDTVTDLFHRTVDMIGPITSTPSPSSSPAAPTGRPRTARRPRSSTSAPTRTAASTGRGGRRHRTPRARAVRPVPQRVHHVQGSADPGTEVVGVPRQLRGHPGRVFIHEGDGMVIVAGPDARTGTNKGLVIERVRLDDGTEMSGKEFFPHGGGYLGR